MELVVVIALVAILSAVSILSLAVYIPNLNLKTVAMELNVQIQKARLEGIRRSRPVVVKFFATDVSGTQKYAPIIWVDNDADATLDTDEPVLYRLPIRETGLVREIRDHNFVRFDNNQAGADAVGDGVTLAGNMFVLNSRGMSDNAGSVHIYNSRGKTREIMVTLGGAVRVF